MPLLRACLILAISILARSAYAADPAADPAKAPARPNILWITCEDISPHLGCYGDTYAVTPNLDRLATESVRYTHAFAPIGVCAPSRSCLITGMYPPAIGTQHMRCDGQLPEGVSCFPAYLRQAGYYCTNNVKTDYNFKHPAGTWDESSNKAHWKNRKPGQPFFAVFNFTSCHESQIRLSEAEYTKRTADFTPAERHDPAKAVLPPYHPDTPEVRQDWARYADMITFMDKQVGQALAELEKAGLTEETIVFYFSDHGAGMPRSKRWLYDSSTRVPMMVRFPAKHAVHAPGKAGSTSDRLVSFVDYGATVLSLTGVEVPKHIQGTALLGEQAGKPREFVYGFRDRMDDRIDFLRSARNGRYLYIRNFLPHLPWFHEQHVSYMYEMPTMKVWQRLADEGKLTGPQAIFMARSKPTEELYDCQSDPHNIQNLAAMPEHQAELVRLRAALKGWQTEIVDLGFLPEADLRTRFGNVAPYDAVRRNPQSYPLARISQAADLANQRDPAGQPKLVELLKDSDPAVRYWGATGLGALGPQGAGATEALESLAEDDAPWVRAAAGDALCRIGKVDAGLKLLLAGLTDKNEWVRLQSINALDRLGDAGRSALPAVQKALSDKNQYVVRVAEHAVKQWSVK